MKLSTLLPLTSATLVHSLAISSTIYWGYVLNTVVIHPFISNLPLRDCWTAEPAGSTTSYLPAATSTVHAPETKTLTFVNWILPEKVRLGKREREETTIYMTNQCTATRTASVTSTIKEVDPTLTATTTVYAETAIVTATSTCADWDC